MPRASGCPELIGMARAGIHSKTSDSQHFRTAAERCRSVYLESATGCSCSRIQRAAAGFEAHERSTVYRWRLFVVVA